MPFKTFLLSTAMATCLVYAQPAHAQETDEERIRQLEDQLQQALQLIQNLSTEVEKLKVQAVAPVDVSSDRVDEIDERLTDIEDVVIDAEERVGSRAVVNAFDAGKLDIGGFLLSTLTHIDGEEGSTTSFNRNVFELLISAELDDDFSLFVAQAFTREASPSFVDPFGRLDPDFNLVTGAPTPIAWANYRASDAFNVRLGRWVTPHGIINIEHFPAILLDTEQPQFLRPFGGQTIFPNFQTGVQIHGKTFAGFEGKGQLKYDLYAGVFGGNQDNINIGGRLGYTFGDTGFTLGLNGTLGRREDELASQYRLAGVDLLYDKGPVLWKTELFLTDEDLGENRTAFYTQPAWRFTDQFIGFYRFDYLDAGTLSGNTTEHAFGLVYDPIPTVRIRGTATFRNFDEGLNGFPEADARLFQLSTTYSF